MIHCLLRERQLSTISSISTELGIVAHICMPAVANQVQWKQTNMLLMLKTCHVLYNNPTGHYRHPQRHSREKQNKKTKQFILVFPGMWRGRTGHTHCLKQAHKLQTCSNREAGLCTHWPQITPLKLHLSSRRIFRCRLSPKHKWGAQTQSLQWATFWTSCASWAVSQRMRSTPCCAQWQSAWHGVRHHTEGKITFTSRH